MTQVPTTAEIPGPGCPCKSCAVSLLPTTRLCAVRDIAYMRQWPDFSPPFDLSFSGCVAVESSGFESFRAFWQMLCALKASVCLFAVTVQTYSQDSAWYPHTGSIKYLTETLWNCSLRELPSFQSPCILFCLVNTKIAQMCILCSGQCTVTKGSLLFECSWLSDTACSWRWPH